MSGRQSTVRRRRPLRQPGRLPGRAGRHAGRLRGVRRRPRLRRPGHPGRRLQGAGDRRQARLRQDRLHATPAGLPGAPGLGVRAPARARPAEDRGGGHRLPVVHRAGAGGEVDADLGPGHPPLARLPPAAAPGAQAPGQRGAPGGDPARLRPAARRGAPAPGHLRRAQQHRARAAHRPPALQLPRRPAVGGPQGPARRGARAHQAGLLLPGRGRRGVRARPDVLAEVPGGALLPGHAAAAGPAPGRPAARGGEHPGHRHVRRAPLRARPPLPERAAHPAAQLGRGVAAAPAAAEAGAAAPHVADAATRPTGRRSATGSASPR